MNSDSPYYVTTNSGKLELTKGSYLTLMKRNHSVAKTLQKSKLLSQSIKQCKKTIKKIYHPTKSKLYSASKEIVLMTAKRSNHTISRQFVVKPDREVFNWPMLPNIPIIDMECDNDCDSEWPEIYECVNHLSMSLSLAVYDRMAEKAALQWLIFDDFEFG